MDAITCVKTNTTDQPKNVVAIETRHPSVGPMRPRANQQQLSSKHGPHQISNQSTTIQFSGQQLRVNVWVNRAQQNVSLKLT